MRDGNSGGVDNVQYFDWFNSDKIKKPYQITSVKRYCFQLALCAEHNTELIHYSGHSILELHETYPAEARLDHLT